MSTVKNTVNRQQPVLYIKEFCRMKIIDILNSKNVTLSFEVFPPKTAAAVPAAEKAALDIAALRPDFMSVTYGAGGGTSDFTVHIAEKIKGVAGVEVMPHLTCISSTKEKVRTMLESFRNGGFETIMALRGDIPAEGIPHRDYGYASELVADIRKYCPDMCIGGACYPDGHCEAPNKDADIENLKKKVDAGVEFLSTQMFFDNAVFYNYLYRLRVNGITVPVLAGIMPITDAKLLGRSVTMSGTTVPARYRAIIDAYGDSPEAIKQAGIIYASEQITDLLANGVKNIHVFTMNKPDVAEAVYSNIKPALDYLNGN